jgi:hypothetical protein
MRDNFRVIRRFSSFLAKSVAEGRASELGAREADNDSHSGDLRLADDLNQPPTQSGR